MTIAKYTTSEIEDALYICKNPTQASKLVGMARGAMHKRCRKEGGRTLALWMACRARGSFRGKKNP